MSLRFCPAQPACDKAEAETEDMEAAKHRSNKPPTGA
jgi:hypothetical protein